jgi:hypothetical protein
MVFFILPLLSTQDLDIGPEGISLRNDISRGLMTRAIWKRPCINLFITYFARADNMLLPRRQITRCKFLWNVHLQTYNDIQFTVCLGLWYLTPHSTTFQLYCGSQVYWWRKLQYQEKTTNLPQVTCSHVVHILYVTLAMVWESVFFVTIFIIVVPES